ncbi:hypothetical protein HK16_04925 [Acetobacter senegalensis]|uniref:Uncharacterized protein n=2 Tax=Acetobacter TaxID=434 RepID=A0A252EE91_9PROT|nr:MULTISPECIES: hypothetical protein [Acetobacter]ATJ91568.1 hypothetical protein CIW82_13560 [Acetobacter tropicalis]OUL64504.1 hypothetical protein HK16_04925 [Acetobacter senegalensis]
MGEYNFTSGPWEVLVGDNYSIISKNYPKNYPNFFKTDDTGPDLAAVGNRSVDCGEANAYLIAAAPELYEVLSDALKQGLSIDVIKKARAALSKARGEAS